ncbi:hypothetical protein ACLIA0_14170 [Bacillaceae bacterium W0354]
MKKLLMSLFLLLILLTGCKSDELSDTSSPAMTISKMDFLSGDLLYEDFKKLFEDGKENEYIKKKYELVRQTRANRSIIYTFSLIRYENNKSLLVHLRHDKDSDDYYIHDVIEVPDDVASFFEKELSN